MKRCDSYGRVPGRVIKAVAVRGEQDCLAAVSAVPTRATVLLDAHDPVKRGGTGRTIDWTQAAAAAKVRPIILSGGLNAENVGDAVARGPAVRHGRVVRRGVAVPASRILKSCVRSSPQSVQNI